MYDILIVGAGITGITLAQKYAELGKKILLIDKRNHIGGNCYDFLNQKGHLIHPYGPHIFHTNNEKVWQYISKFTKWNNYKHTVKSFIRGKLYPFPININTINKLFDKNYDEVTIKKFFDTKKTHIKNPTNAKDVILNQVGEQLYKLFFEKYTTKQWGMSPEKLSPEITGRIKIKLNKNNFYFTDKYQGLPLESYTSLFKKMLDNKYITIMLNTNFNSLSTNIKYNNVIFTGPIDSFFNNKYGKLPYRSLKFEIKSYEFNKFQKTATINYPGNEKYTRITEFKHMTLQNVNGTTTLTEFPSSQGPEFYPILTTKSKKLFKQYMIEANKIKNVYFLGRLGSFSYINMDKAVELALRFVNIQKLQ
ncbi:MAG: UDP-galactopyranose mutase [Candidatus Woesearchaeota archaeon]